MGETQQWGQLNPGEEKGHILEGSEVTCPTPNCLPEKAKLFWHLTLQRLYCISLCVYLVLSLMCMYLFFALFLFLCLYHVASRILVP